MITDPIVIPFDTRRARVLVVEDRGSTARGVGSRLQRAGYELAAVVDTGEAALERVLADTPDLVLIDARLRGDIDGIETVQRLQEQVDVPIVCLTAHTDRDALERAKLTSRFGDLTKPVSEVNLPASLEAVLYRHRLKRELRQQRAWLETVLQHRTEGVLLIDQFGAVQYLNPAAEALTGWRNQDAQELPCGEVVRLFDPQEHRLVEAPLTAVLTKRQSTALPTGLCLITRTGLTCPVEGEFAPGWHEGNALGAVITLRHASTCQAAEQEVQQQQKMQAIGQVAAGVAHDFNNLLTVILGSADRIRTDEAPLTLPVVNALEEIQRAAVTAAAIARQVLAFSRKQSMQPQPLDLNRLICDNESVYRRLLGPAISWNAQLEPGLLLLHASPGQLAQVILNLVTNARDAMPQGGMVTVETASLIRAGQRQTGAGEERCVVLTVRDTGTGMNSTVAKHLFEPFFTSKPAGRGTGLGLSIVQRIVTALHGNISVKSQPGQGTTFTVCLPVAEGPSLAGTAQ